MSCVMTQVTTIQVLPVYNQMAQVQQVRNYHDRVRETNDQIAHRLEMQTTYLPNFYRAGLNHAWPDDNRKKRLRTCSAAAHDRRRRASRTADRISASSSAATPGRRGRTYHQARVSFSWLQEKGLCAAHVPRNTARQTRHVRDLVLPARIHLV